jgi:UDP-N-acetyl-D-mannosaminuronate dehydrogenase
VRDNLTLPLVNLLEREGATTVVYDPLVPGHDDSAVLECCDAIVLMTAHSVFKSWTEADLLERCSRCRDEVFVFDLWNIWPWANRIFGKGTDDHYEDPGHGSERLAHARGDSATAV